MLWTALAALVSVAGLAWIGGAIAERREVDRQTSQLRTDLLLRQELEGGGGGSYAPPYGSACRSA